MRGLSAGMGSPRPGGERSGRPRAAGARHPRLWPAVGDGGHADDKWFPTDDNAWTSIVQRVVQHFGDKVQAYEVWNEPNIESFGNYGSDRKARYWQLVRLASDEIRAGC